MSKKNESAAPLQEEGFQQCAFSNDGYYLPGSFMFMWSRPIEKSIFIHEMIENFEKQHLKDIKFHPGQKLEYTVGYDRDGDRLLIGVRMTNEKGIVELIDMDLASKGLSREDI